VATIAQSAETKTAPRTDSDHLGRNCGSGMHLTSMADVVALPGACLV
jgi:hypothetical protein